MSYITIEVEDDIAKAFNAAKPDEKNRLAKSAGFFIKKKLIEKNKEKHKEFLNQLGKEAQSKGITPEILAEILGSNE
jgi:phosphotransacetylase